MLFTNPHICNNTYLSFDLSDIGHLWSTLCTVSSTAHQMGELGVYTLLKAYPF